jgi:hypothetical protein
LISLEKEVKDETWTIPNACQELGEVYYWSGNLDEAENWMKKANKYSGYDWHDVVGNRIRLSLETIRKDKKAKGNNNNNNNNNNTNNKEEEEEEVANVVGDEEKMMEDQMNKMKLDDEEGDGID